MGKITSSSRKGMRHYQSTLTCLDMHLGNQSQIQIWNSDGIQKSQNKWSRTSQKKADSSRCCWTELTPASMSLQEWSCGVAESEKLEHFSLNRFFNVSNASFSVRTVSLKHIVGIHCKEFSRKWNTLVCFISNCESDSEIFILSGPRHWEFPPPLFHFPGFFSPQILPFQRHNYSKGFSGWFSSELATIESSTRSVLEVTNTSGTARNCRAWNSPSLFKLKEFHYPKGIADWTPWRPSLTPSNREEQHVKHMQNFGPFPSFFWFDFSHSYEHSKAHAL